jgi:hypothetical protein
MNNDYTQKLKGNQMRQMYTQCNKWGEQLHFGPGFYVLLIIWHSVELTIRDFDDFTDPGFDDFPGQDFDDKDDEAGPHIYIVSDYIPGTDIPKATDTYLNSLQISNDDMVRTISDIALHLDVHLTYYLVPFLLELNSHEMEVVHDLMRIEGAHHLLIGEETLMFQRRKSSAFQ